MDDVWRDDDTTPGRIEAELRNMFTQRHKEERAYVPARVMNMVVIVDKDFRGEIDNRLRRVGRFHPSRLVVVAVEPGRRRLTATVRIGTEDAPQSGSIAVGRERVELQVGERHLAKLDTIVDPLMVSALATMVWSPHGHPDVGCLVLGDLGTPGFPEPENVGLRHRAHAGNNDGEIRRAERVECGHIAAQVRLVPHGFETQNLLRLR